VGLENQHPSNGAEEVGGIYGPEDPEVLVEELLIDGSLCTPAVEVMAVFENAGGQDCEPNAEYLGLAGVDVEGVLPQGDAGLIQLFGCFGYW
jgi:hypothetical protein